jgi:hypothetical protein
MGALVATVEDAPQVTLDMVDDAAARGPLVQVPKYAMNASKSACRIAFTALSPAHVRPRAA